MTQENKQLLLKDLCARLPYHPILHFDDKVQQDDEYLYGFRENGGKFLINDAYYVEEVKPYLRPMSSITKEEVETLRLLKNQLVDCDESNDEKFYNIIDEIHSFYYSHHIDSNNLIPIGLAIAATKENNPYKE